MNLKDQEIQNFVEQENAICSFENRMPEEN